jgi:hypothetical protein
VAVGKNVKKLDFLKNVLKHNELGGDSGMGSDSGWVVVVPLERGDQGGSNGTG